MKPSREPGLEREGRFLDLVVFKWWMAGLGWRVDVARLQRDKAYARECLQRALGSDSAPLRQYGLELLDPRAD